ncbi:MAG: aldehyde dehydrogenase [Saprospiraceae bacterium]|nr:aldehyde dehydrogenase [Saprospiraceae bacterium]MDW8484970.1 aldehyde dehydrogenase [Saprospiraceae bacterium]
MEKLLNYIGGQYVPPISGRYVENVAPATGEVFSLVPDSGSEDVEAAVEAAEAAFPAWSALSLEKRHDILRAISDRIAANIERLAQAECLDTGKTITAARTVDIPRAALNFKFFATALLHFASESYHMPGALSYTLRQPLGVVGGISPWNLPLYLFTWKIAPALAAGNCVVGKPSEVTPYTAYLLGEICNEAGLPPGVLNIVHGRGSTAGEAIVRHPKVKAISFTGSTRAGAEIARIAAPMFKKLSLELGGKNPNLIFADCDYEQMLETTVASSFNNQGQICLCGSRIYIERPLYERFRRDFVARVQGIRVGDPADPQTRLGAVVSKAHFDKILAYIELAQQEGGRILCGGHAIQLPGRLAGGYYIAPTVVEGLPLECRTNQEEIFGPVVTIAPFDTDEEALALANGVPYGLSATLWTNNLTRAHYLSMRLQAGIVWVNCWMLRDLRTPFGGVKQSGVGREGGWEALRFFTETKSVTIAEH